MSDERSEEKPHGGGDAEDAENEPQVSGHSASQGEGEMQTGECEIQDIGGGAQAIGMGEEGDAEGKNLNKETPPSALPVVSAAPQSPITTPPSTPTVKASGSCKIDVLLKPAGNAPILKKKKWSVDRHKQIGWISEFIRKFIRTETEDSVFVYVNQSFSPSPDTEIGTLFDCFGSDGKLVIYYCRTQAWG